MCILTDEGLFLKGHPIDLVARLGALTRVGAGSRAGVGDRESMLMQLECARIGGYQTEIGPHFAEFAASRLLESLEEEGLILIQR
jgi:hypothetical protein